MHSRDRIVTIAHILKAVQKQQLMVQYWKGILSHT